MFTGLGQKNLGEHPGRRQFFSAPNVTRPSEVVVAGSREGFSLPSPPDALPERGEKIPLERGEPGLGVGSCVVLPEPPLRIIHEVEQHLGPSPRAFPLQSGPLSRIDAGFSPVPFHHIAVFPRQVSRVGAN